MNCPICGAEMDGCTEVCASCGARIDWGIPTEPVDEPEPTYEPEPEQPEKEAEAERFSEPQEMPNGNSPADRLTRGITVCIVFSAVAAVVGLIGVFLKNYDMCYLASTVDSFLLMGGVVISIFAIVMGGKARNLTLKKRGIVGLIVLGVLFFLCTLFEMICMILAPTPEQLELFGELLTLLEQAPK